MLQTPMDAHGHTTPRRPQPVSSGWLMLQIDEPLRKLRFGAVDSTGTT
jgi:hypothetical protein